MDREVERMLMALPLAMISFSVVSVWASVLFCFRSAAELSELLPKSKSIGSMKTVRVDLNIRLNPPSLRVAPARHK
jgi:hypothetical protein